MVFKSSRGRSSLLDEFREGRSKSVVVPETMDAVRQMILQDSHVTYREIETTSIHSILHEHLTVKKICSLGIPHYLLNAQKKGSCELVEKNASKIRSRWFGTRLCHRDRR